MTDIVWKCSFDGGAKRGSPGGEKTAIVRSQRGLGIPCPTVPAGTAQKGKIKEDRDSGGGEPRRGYEAGSLF